jgi:hypothetical protein
MIGLWDEGPRATGGAKPPHARGPGGGATGDGGGGGGRDGRLRTIVVSLQLGRPDRSQTTDHHSQAVGAQNPDPS